MKAKKSRAKQPGFFCSIQLSVVSDQQKGKFSTLLYTSFSADLSDERTQHLFYLNNSPLNAAICLVIHEMQVFGEKTVILQFAGGSHCHLKKSLKFAIASSSTSFSYICADGRTRTPNLRDKAKDFMLGKTCRR